MNTIIKNASVKVMLSYDYSHFESSMTIENGNGLNVKDINEARKTCQRLSDEAVRQYKKAKEMAAKRVNSVCIKGAFEAQCKLIKSKPEGERTINEVAMLKQYEDENWQSQFDYLYDYDDDELPY